MKETPPASDRPSGGHRMSPKARAETILLCATLVWGSTFTAVKIALAEVSPLQMMVLRFGFVVVVLLLVASKHLFPIRRAALVKGIILGVLLFVGFIAQNIGLLYTTASKSAFITGMMVVLVPLLQFIIERRAPRLGNVIGVLIVAAGLWFLTSPAGSAFNLGDALTVSCAFMFGFYIVYLDIVSREMTALQLTFVQSATNAALGVAAVFMFESMAMHLSLLTIGLMAYLAIFATLLTTFLQTRFQRDTTPTRAAVIFSIEPVIASIVAYFVLGEHLGSLGILGGGLIVFGVLVSELSDGIPVLNRSLDAISGEEGV